MVHVVYCIWHESYFALNQKTNTVMISFVVIGLVNLLIGLINLANGNVIKNGRLSFAVLNLIAAVLFIVLFLTLLLRKIVKGSENADAEEEE